MKVIIALLILTTLASCSSRSGIETDTDWYLRSEFTWWEAKPEYKLRHVAEGQYMQTDFSVAPDGTVFHLKVADSQWQRDKNCGMVNPSNDEIRLDVWYPLTCDYDKDDLTPLYNAYHFYPPQKGRYQMQVKFAKGRPVSMLVTAISR